jgi:hypothetical protein
MFAKLNNFIEKSKYTQTKIQSNINVFISLFLFYLWVFSFTFPIVTLGMTVYNKNLKFLYLYLSASFFSKVVLKCIRMKKGAKSAVQNMFLNALHEYFNIKRVNCNMNKYDKKLLYAEFPHGIFTAGFMINSLEGDKHNIKNAVSDAMYHCPFAGDLAKLFGGTPCNKINLNCLMEQGENIHLMPGGFNEILLTENYTYNLYVDTWFIAMCVKHNYNIIPVLNIGENETYCIYKLPRSIYRLIFNYIYKYIKLPVFFALGKNFTLAPYNTNIWSLYGKPIECGVRDNEEIHHAVERIQQRICRNLKDLFYENIHLFCKKYDLDPKMYKINIYG